ncbi:YybH family protein [Sphingomicrobium aestuariivivum]|uniref:YybH family protein n=1 Tax=Sphingomicrobium aestuariivivum TaxID=1582356 RepID=UPI001FD71966|nr:nuclear transport factor 2 family protein [Sphingomicrobium aestuariivivum]MCJ8190996.1 nuclear transport factor 2 family protein [Sphingomicrobium aestuariivivum]
MRLTIIALALGLAACQQQEPDAPAAPDLAETRAAIEAVLDASDDGWNEGDMDKFLSIYSDDPATSYVGSKGLSRGKAEFEERYRNAYDWSAPDNSERGTLSMETLDVRPLGPDHALYIGRYTLTYADDRDPDTGLTSLVFAREGEDWRIIADHSS